MASSAVGEWSVKSFPSGTVVVTTGKPGDPHYYVHGHHRSPREQRYEVACQLRDWLNGGPRHVWMGNLWRDSETRATHEDGFAITATGPMVDRDPPNLDWVEDDTRDLADARARLIDRLCGVPDGE